MTKLLLQSTLVQKPAINEFSNKRDRWPSWSKALDSSSSVVTRVGSNPTLFNIFLLFACCLSCLFLLPYRRTHCFGTHLYVLESKGLKVCSPDCALQLCFFEERTRKEGNGMAGRGEYKLPFRPFRSVWFLPIVLAACSAFLFVLYYDCLRLDKVNRAEFFVHVFTSIFHYRCR